MHQPDSPTTQKERPEPFGETSVWSPVSLPFQRPVENLPANLSIPTPDEIRNTTTIIKQRIGQTVVAVGRDILVKYGRSTSEREGQTLLYLETCLPKVPAPRLYSMYYDAEDLFIVMELVPGAPLDILWQDITEDEKTALTAELRCIFEGMRLAVCPDPAFFGSVDRGPVPDHLFYSMTGDKKITGPFDSEKAFNDALVLQYRTIRDMNGYTNFKTAFYERNIHQAMRGHKPTFTHCDAQRKNIVVDLKGEKDQEKPRSFDVFLVDWEEAGWYPEYWEYFSAFIGLSWNDDWGDRVEEFIPAWPAEAAWMRMVHQDLFF